MSDSSDTELRLDLLRKAMLRSRVTVEAKKGKDLEDRKEESAAARKSHAETQTIIESNRDLRVNRKLRWKYARWVFCYLVSYSAFVGLLLLLAGLVFVGFHCRRQFLNFWWVVRR